MYSNGDKVNAFGNSVNIRSGMTRFKSTCVANFAHRDAEHGWKQGMAAATESMLT
jgi:hypothetical protein